MDKQQTELTLSMLRKAAEVDAFCRNLQTRLKDVPLQLKESKAWKPVAEASGFLLKEAKACVAEMLSVAKAYPEKKREVTDMPTYKKKTEKMLKQIERTSQAAQIYWTAYKKAQGADPSIGAATAAKASFSYAGDLIGAATQTKIAYNQMK